MLIKFSFPAHYFRFQKIGKAILSLILIDQLALCILVFHILDAS